MSVVKDITDKISPVVDKNGYRLWDVKLTKAGKRSIVSVTIDKEGGPTLDGIADLSKAIAPILDEMPTLENAYHLEVASPGLERSLITPEHFQWSKNLDVAISHRSDGSLTRTRGKLIEVSPSVVKVQTEDGDVVIELETITKAHTIFDFKKAMKQNPNKSDQEIDEQGESDE